MAEFTVKIKSLATEETHIYSLDKFNEFRRLYKDLEQRLKAGQHETIVNCTVAELKKIAEKASDLRDTEYAINKFHETPTKFSIGDIRVVLEALKNVKCN